MSSFVFVGASPAVDFVNTEIVSAGERVDLLQSIDDFSAWLREAGLTQGDARAVSLREVKSFRASLRQLFTRLAKGGSVRRSDLDLINEKLQRGRGSFRLESKKGKLGIRFEGKERDPLFLIANAAAELLAGGDPSLIRQCEGRGCILFFYDETKSHTRRWCSMAGCGNRMKSILHYQRTRALRE